MLNTDPPSATTDVLAKRGRDDLLALVASGLVVVLDAVRPLQLEAPDVCQRVFEAVDHRIATRRAGSVHDLAGRKGAGGEDDPGPLHLGCRENLARRARRVVNRGHPEGQVSVSVPVLLRDEIVLALRAVGVGLCRAMLTFCEGVETADDLATLHEIGVGPAQGWFLARPAEPNMMLPALAASRTPVLVLP